MRARIFLVPLLFASIFNRILSETYETHHIGGGEGGGGRGGGEGGGRGGGRGGRGGGISTRPVFRQGQIKDKVSTDLERLRARPTRKTSGSFQEDGPPFLGMRLDDLRRLINRCCRKNFGPNKKTETKLSRIISEQEQGQEEDGSAFETSPGQADEISAIGTTTQRESNSDYENVVALIRQLAQYKSWRSENGYGRHNSRWGRRRSERGSNPLVSGWKRRSEGGRKVSRGIRKYIHLGLPVTRPLAANRGGEEEEEENDDPDENPVDFQQLARSSSAASRMTFSRSRAPGKEEESERWKRDPFRRGLRTLDDLSFPPKLKEALEDYRTWRSRNGYGKLAGRWG